MPVTNDPQHSIYEKTVEDDELEAQLDHREELRQAAKEANAAYRKADELTKSKLEALDLGIGAAVRIGGYVVTVKETAGRSVAFETEPGQRLQISLLDKG